MPINKPKSEYGYNDWFNHYLEKRDQFGFLGANKKRLDDDNWKSAHEYAKKQLKRYASRISGEDRQRLASDDRAAHEIYDAMDPRNGFNMSDMFGGNGGVGNLSLGLNDDETDDRNNNSYQRKQDKDEPETEKEPEDDISSDEEDDGLTETDDTGNNLEDESLEDAPESNEEDTGEDPGTQGESGAEGNPVSKNSMAESGEGLGEAAEGAAGAAEGTAAAAEGAAAAAEGVAAAAEGAAVAAEGAAVAAEGLVAFFSTPVGWVVAVILIILFVLLFLWLGTTMATAYPGADDSSEVATNEEVLKYCTENYNKYTSEAELKSIFGNSESEVKSQLEYVTLPTNSNKVSVHKKAYPCYQAVAQELESVGYKISSYGTTFSWRANVNNTSSLSFHSFAIATDINPGANPNGGGTPPNCKTDMPTEFVNVWKKYGFRWGGNYRSTCDAMHFEWLGGAPNVPIPNMDTSSSGGSNGVVLQPSHQTDTSGGQEAKRANIIADYALAAISTTSKKKVSSWPNQTSLNYWNTGSNACTKTTASGTGYYWEISESNKISPKVFIGIHLNGGTKGVSVQGFYHDGESENKAFAADLAAEIDSATSLSAVSPGKDSLDRDCGSYGTRYKSSDGKNGFFSIDARVNKAKYRVILEIGDNATNQSFWTESNMKKVGEAIARVANEYAKK